MAVKKTEEIKEVIQTPEPIVYDPYVMDEKKSFDVKQLQVPKVETPESENKDKLLIMGFSPTSFDDGIAFIKKYPGCEVWCMNMFYVQSSFPFNMATRWFELHHVPTNSSVNPAFPDGANHRQNLRGIPIPIYVQNKEQDWKDFPQERLIEFPAKEIVEKFPRKYFSSTPSWILAYAFLEGLKTLKENGKFRWSKIMMAGVDMMSGWNKKLETQADGTQKMVDVIASEYAMQRPSVEWLCGYFDSLKMLDIDCELQIPIASTLFKNNNLYGFEEYFLQQDVIERKKRIEIRYKWINERLNNLQNNMAQITQRANQEVAQLQRQIDATIGSKQEIELEISEFS